MENVKGLATPLTPGMHLIIHIDKMCFKLHRYHFISLPCQLVKIKLWVDINMQMIIGIYPGGGVLTPEKDG